MVKTCSPRVWGRSFFFFWSSLLASPSHHWYSREVKLPKEPSLLSPRIAQTISSAKPPSSTLGKASFQEVLHRLLLQRSDEPGNVFLEQATFFCFGYRSFAYPGELVLQLSALAANWDGKSHLFDFVRILARSSPDFAQTGMLQRLLALENLPQDVANDLKLQMIRAQATKRPESLSTLPSSGGGFGNTLKADWTTLQIAEQLTLSEASLFYQIGFDEFLGMRVEEEKVHRAPNLTKLAEMFNHVSHWVSSMVIGARGQKNRISEIERFICVMESMRLLQNFDGLMAVMSGLNNAAVSRLKEDFEQISTEKKQSFAVLETLMDSTRNFRAYRDELNRIRIDSPKKGVLPYMAIHLRDILMIEMGNPRPGDDVIDFDNVILFGSALSKLCYFQRHPYQQEAILEIQKCILVSEALSDDELHLRSLQIRSADGIVILDNVNSPPQKSLKDSKVMQALSPRFQNKETYQNLEQKSNPLFGQEKAVSKNTSSMHALNMVATEKEKEEESKESTINSSVPLLKLSIPESESRDAFLLKSPRPTKQSMTTEKGEFLVIPTCDSESLAFAATNPGFYQLVQECEKRNIILPKSHYVRFFVVNLCNFKAALKNIVDYWSFYSSIGFKNIVTMDVSAALQSFIIAPPFSDCWVRIRLFNVV